MPPAPLLILCSPRSFSSVVCAMLGQHPNMYAFPELNLFVTDTVGELLQLQESEQPYTGVQALSYTSGMLRVIAEFEFGSQTVETIDKAREWFTHHLHWTTKQMFNFLLDHVQPRMGVDKSPRTALCRASLDRALTAYPHSRIIHLTRHPVGTVQSMISSHGRYHPTLGDQPLPPSLINFYARLWCSAQTNILHCTASLPPHQTILVHGEDLLKDPDTELRKILQWLELSHAPENLAAMRHPERSPYAWTGIPDVEGDNDPGFLHSPVLRTGLAYDTHESSLPFIIDPSLRETVREFGARLNY